MYCVNTYTCDTFQTQLERFLSIFSYYTAWIHGGADELTIRGWNSYPCVFLVVILNVRMLIAYNKPKMYMTCISIHCAYSRKIIYMHVTTICFNLYCKNVHLFILLMATCIISAPTDTLLVFWKHNCWIKICFQTCVCILAWTCPGIHFQNE